MAKKTVIKKVLKYAPLKTEVVRALTADETIKLDEYTDSSEYGTWTAFGWIITTAGIRKRKEEARKEKVFYLA